MSEYAGQQFVGIDLHRRRSVIVRIDRSRARCWSGPDPQRRRPADRGDRAGR